MPDKCQTAEAELGTVTLECADHGRPHCTWCSPCPVCGGKTYKHADFVQYHDEITYSCKTLTKNNTKEQGEK